MYEQCQSEHCTSNVVQIEDWRLEPKQDMSSTMWSNLWNFGYFQAFSMTIGMDYLLIIINFQMIAWVDLASCATCSELEVSQLWVLLSDASKQNRDSKLAAPLVPCCWFVCQDIKNKTKTFVCGDICEICNPIAPTCLWISLTNVSQWNLWKAIARLSNAAILEAGTLTKQVL